MKNFNKAFFFGIVLVLILIIVYTLASQDKKSDYKSKLIEAWADKDYMFKTSDKSPIQKKEIFEKLSYFPPNPSFRLEAKVNLIKDTTVFNVRTTDGKKEKYIRFANATFNLGGKPHQLLLLKPVNNPNNEPDYLFLAFTDKTSGRSTYGGGRYLDLKYKGEKIILDFNLAYNPYCSYNPNYSCPLPPNENYLNIAIEAGEKTLEKE